MVMPERQQGSGGLRWVSQRRRQTVQTRAIARRGSRIQGTERTISTQGTGTTIITWGRTRTIHTIMRSL